jgi:hypothetical protein
MMSMEYSKNLTLIILILAFVIVLYLNHLF